MNFANTNTTDAINNIFGGLNAAPALLDEQAKNNAKGQTATFAGLITSLTDQGGNVQVLPLVSGANAIDYCTAAVPITLPTLDARQFTRDANPDAGAYENDITSTNNPPVVDNAITDVTQDEGFGTFTIDISTVFSDPDGDALSYNVSSSDETVVTASLVQTTLTLTEQGAGSATITLSADDSNGAITQTTFVVNVNGSGGGGGGGGGGNQRPFVANPIADLELNSGFISEAIDLNIVFDDPDGDNLTFQAAAITGGVVSTSISNGILTLEEVNNGTTEITLVAEDGRGGVESSSFIVTVGVILDITQIESSIILYPNPVATQLRLELPESSNEVNFEVYNLNGQLKVLPNRIDGNKIVIEVGRLTNGLYNLIINIEDKQIIKRFIKE